MVFSLLLFLVCNANPIWEAGVHIQKNPCKLQKKDFNPLTLLQQRTTEEDLKRQFSVLGQEASEDLENATEYLLAPGMTNVKGVRSVSITCDQNHVACRVVFKIDKKQFYPTVEKLRTRYHLTKKKEFGSGDKFASFKHDNIEILLMSPHQLQIMRLEYMTTPILKAINQQFAQGQKTATVS